MQSVNEVTLLGRLGADPELKYTPSGTPCVTFSLATSRKYTGENGNEVERVTWHRIVTWKKTAELCDKFLKKGSLAYLQGRIEGRTYTDNQGISRYATEIVASRVVFLDRPPQRDQEPLDNYPGKNQPDLELEAVETVAG